MSNSIGKSVILTLFGESHGPYIGVVIDGLSAGIKINEDFISAQLAKRRPTLAIETSRVEKDHYEIISGVMNGYTTGMPLCIIIPNENVKSSDYEKNYGIARPSHADYVAHMKYDGFEDYRGGGHFSGRLTAGIVAAGAICLDALLSGPANQNNQTHPLRLSSMLLTPRATPFVSVRSSLIYLFLSNSTNSLKRKAVSVGPDAASGWNWTENHGFVRWRIPSLEPSFIFINQGIHS